LSRLPAGGGASADLIRAALAGADTYVWEWCIDTDWLSDIDEGLAMLGYATGEIGHTQADWNRLIHPDDLAANDDAYQRHARGETPVYEHTYRIRAADGGWRWMQERGRVVERHADGSARRMVGTQSDITQRRAAELAAQESMMRLASIARSVPQVLFQSRRGPDGHREILYISDNCTEVLGLTPQQLRADADALVRLIHPDDVRSLPGRWPAAVMGELVHEFRLHRPDHGALRWMRVSASHQAQPDGTTLWHGSFEDVTERRELEHAREAAAQALAASGAKTQFLARMSHELRTPLNAVLGFAQLMELDQDEPAGAGQQRRLRLIREAGEHLLLMINDMLDLTRIESGGMALQPEPVALRALVEQALAMLHPSAEKAQVRLLLMPGADGVVLADPTRVRQVLLNLLTNGIKYNRAGGRVEVEVSATPDHASVAVRDTGLGIAEADLPRIFEPFHRGGHAGSAVDGAGIGLAVTRALVQLMGGAIQARSELGVGSVFSVSLPAAVHSST